VPETVSLANFFTSRVRFTVELWSLSDRMGGVSVAWVPLFLTESAELPEPTRVCAPPVSLSRRSMLDETRGDSWCIGRICQAACRRAANFSFDKVVAARFLVLEGGDVWRDGQLVATPSDRTRVYALNGSHLSAVSVNDAGAITRAWLVGDPVANLSTVPTPAFPVGLPGIFVKRFRASVTGASPVRVPALFDGQSTAPDTMVSVVSVANATVALSGNGTLWWFRNGTWQVLPSTGLSTIVVNRDGVAPARRLVSIGSRFVLVIAASTVLHDGSKLPLLVNRLVTQNALDVFDTKNSGAWFTDVLQHDIAKNMSDVELVQWNSSMFAVVDSATGAASVFDWQPFATEPRACAENTDCQSCLATEANIAACRWCSSSSRCTGLFSTCAPNESSVVNASSASCAGPPTTTAPMSETTAAVVPPSTADERALSNTDAGADDTTLGLAIGIPVAIGALVCLAVGVWFAVKRAREPNPKQKQSKSEPGVQVQLKPKPTADEASSDSLGVSISASSED
jgi:hypothetical protein